MTFRSLMSDFMAEQCVSLSVSGFSCLKCKRKKIICGCNMLINLCVIKSPCYCYFKVFSERKINQIDRIYLFKSEAH
jgi:hypothetical protein